MALKNSCSDWRQLTKITVRCLACECEEGSMQRQLLLGLDFRFAASKYYDKSTWLPLHKSILPEWIACFSVHLHVFAYKSKLCVCVGARFQLQTWQCCSSDQESLEEQTPLGMMPQIVPFVIMLVLWKHLLWQKFYMFCLGVQFSPVQTSHWTSQVALHSCAIAASGLRRPEALNDIFTCFL